MTVLDEMATQSRGDDALLPERSGHIFNESMGGTEPAATAAESSAAGTFAKKQNVLYQSAFKNNRRTRESAALWTAWCL